MDLPAFPLSSPHAWGCTGLHPTYPPPRGGTTRVVRLGVGAAAAGLGLGHRHSVLVVGAVVHAIRSVRVVLGFFEGLLKRRRWEVVTDHIREVGSDGKIPLYRISKGWVKCSIFHKEVLGQEILVMNCWEGLGLHAYLLHLVCW